MRKGPDPHAGINQEGRRDDVGQPGAYAEADQTSKPAIWLRDLPGSGQQRRPEMRKNSLSRLELLEGPPPPPIAQDTARGHISVQGPCRCPRAR